MTTVVQRGTNRPAARIRRERAAQRTPLPERAPQPLPLAIGYGRQSKTDETDPGYSLSSQRATVTTEGQRRGYDVDWTEDADASGRYVNRKLRASLERLAAGRADALIVAKMDRLARSVSHAADILDLAKTQGWNLIICDLGVDLASPQGRAMAQMLAVFAEFERAMISTRTREGLAVARAKGKRIGRRRITPSAIVDRVVRDRDTGASFNAIAQGLTDEGCLSPEGRPAWQASTVRRIYNAATKERAA